MRGGVDPIFGAVHSHLENEKCESDERRKWRYSSARVGHSVVLITSGDARELITIFGGRLQRDLSLNLSKG